MSHQPQIRFYHVALLFKSENSAGLCPLILIDTDRNLLKFIVATSFDIGIIDNEFHTAKRCKFRGLWGNLGQAAYFNKFQP